MEATKHYLLSERWGIPGRPVLPALRSREAILAVTLILLPIAFVLLLACLLASSIQNLAETFLLIFKKEN